MFMLFIDQCRTRWPVWPVGRTWWRTPWWFCVLQTATSGECRCLGRGSTPPCPPSVELLSTGGTLHLHLLCLWVFQNWLPVNVTRKQIFELIGWSREFFWWVGCRFTDTWIKHFSATDSSCNCDLIMSSMSPAVCWTSTKHQHHEGMCRTEGLSSQPWMTSSFLCRGPRGPREEKPRSFLQSFTPSYLIFLSSVFVSNAFLWSPTLTFKPYWIMLPAPAPGSVWRHAGRNLPLHKVSASV